MITALVGGQYGSEGKGLIAGHIGRAHKHHIRVGAANAGHTLYTATDEHVDRRTQELQVDWEKHVVQQIPCGAYSNPQSEIYLGPGALISPRILQDEMRRLVDWRARNGMPSPQLYIDPRAHIITEEQIEEEQESGLAERIGSTSTIAREGIGAAQAARVMRREDCVQVGEYWRRHEATTLLVRIANVPILLGTLPKNDANRILAEGTQGYGLSLTTGDFPYVTSRNTTAPGLLAECGLPAKKMDSVIVVFRTYPIRVAGPSGPFHDESDEIEWSDLGVDPESERTTVTKKVRRVATFSYSQAWEACKVNGATDVALTFCDYVDPSIHGLAGIWERNGKTIKRYPKVLAMIDQLEYEAEAPVTMLGTGPHSVIDLK
jgi:adenylosuccinate synthase